MEIALVVCGKDPFPFGHLKLSIEITWQVQVQGAFRHVPEWTFGRLAVQFRPLPSVWAPKLLACLKTEYTTQIGFIVKRKNDDFSSGFRRFSVFHAFHGFSHGFPSIFRQKPIVLIIYIRCIQPCWTSSASPPADEPGGLSPRSPTMSEFRTKKWKIVKLNIYIYIWPNHHENSWDHFFFPFRIF